MLTFCLRLFVEILPFRNGRTPSHWTESETAGPGSTFDAASDFFGFNYKVSHRDLTRICQSPYFDVEDTSLADIAEIVVESVIEFDPKKSIVWAS